jgi:hypothetical protein
MILWNINTSVIMAQLKHEFTWYWKQWKKGLETLGKLVDHCLCNWPTIPKKNIFLNKPLQTWLTSDLKTKKNIKTQTEETLLTLWKRRAKAINYKVCSRTIGILHSLMNTTKNRENMPLPLHHNCVLFSVQKNKNSYSVSQSNFKHRKHTHCLDSVPGYATGQY